MADVKIVARVEGIREAVNALNRIERNARRRAVSAGVSAGNRLLRARARMEAPMQTGVLRKSIRSSMRLDRATGTVVGMVSAGGKQKNAATAYYAYMVHEGTKPHNIKARKKYMLVNGRYVRETVMHPGARPNPFLTRTIEAMYNSAVNAFNEAFVAKVEQEVAKR